ncbi:cytidylyltransferase domain-containing protein [Luminiphilus sp. nBUS_07]|uniref:acylneuraminate cytidylyltransferase family protein n=1 Tax=Luminiphilus sp. nBUS_07 TaxID=3395314 RepID=UPI003EBBDA3D
MVTALLPMKANSQRVPGKNFKPLCGRPLYRWILDNLLAVGAVERVIINTDATVLLSDPCLLNDRRIILRERDLALRGDAVSMNKILASDVAFDTASTFLMTHTTNPFLSVATITTALNKFKNALVSGSADSLFSVNRFQTRFYRTDGSAINHDSASLVQTQDLEPWYEENSCLYLFTRESFSSTEARIGRNPIMFETPRFESIDIDTPVDWEMAELVAPLFESRSEMPN